jgi:uncharacterized protein YegP (UPF0339 family)
LLFFAEKRIMETQGKREVGMSKFEVYESKSGWRWRLKAGNGEVVATGEEYTTKDGAVRGCEAVARAAADAEVVEVEN